MICTMVALHAHQARPHKVRRIESDTSQGNILSDLHKGQMLAQQMKHIVKIPTRGRIKNKTNLQFTNVAQCIRNSNVWE